MYSVNVQNVCRCFLRAGMPEMQDFSTMEEAKAEADRMLKQMQDNFCKKHEFILNEQFGNYTIIIRPR